MGSVTVVEHPVGPDARNATPWMQFPAPAGRPGGPRGWLIVVAGALPPLGLVMGSASGSIGAAIVAVVGASAAAAVWLTKGSIQRLVSVVCAVLVVGVIAGRSTAVVALGSLALVGSVRNRAGRGASHAQAPAQVAEPAVGLSVLAFVVGVRTGSVLTVAGIQVFALVAVALAARYERPASRLRSALSSATGVFLGALRSLLIWLLGIPLVLLPWALGRLVRWDPTSAPTRAGSAFVPLRREPIASRWQWRGRVESLPPRPARRASGILVVCLLILVAGLAVAVGLTRAAGDPTGVGSAAMESSPWWEEARPAQLATYDEATLSGFLGPTLADVSTPWTNVVDGRRVSWTPDAPRFRVWLMGGSSVFGLGQRDDHTIASELARSARAHGASVEVVNMGVHGDVHWMEWNRTLAALAAGEKPPDLVVYYDGFNDLATVNHVNGRSGAGGMPFIGSLDSGELSRGGPMERLGRRVGSWFNETGLEEASSKPRLTQAQVVRQAVDQYAEAIGVTASELGRRGIPFLFVYQPSRVTRAVPVEGEGEDGAEFRRMEEEFRTQLPAGVLDLSDAMDDVEGPVYWDSVHTNETGARVVANELTGPVLAQLEGGG